MTTTKIFVGAGSGEGKTQGMYRGGLFLRNPGEGEWKALANGLPEKVEVRTIAVHPQDSNILFVGTQDGPYRSIDGGTRWEKLNFPDKNAVIWTMSVHPTKPNIVYAGAAPVVVYRSEDGGDNWKRLPAAKSPAHCERGGFDTRTIRITVDPSRPDDLYVAIEVSGVIRSSDAGETFTDVSQTLIDLAHNNKHLQSNVGGRHCGHCEGMLDSHALAISAAAPGTPFLALRMGIFKSEDRGAHWHDINVGRYSPLTYCRDVIVSPHNPRTMYAALSAAAFSTDGSLYRSDDLAQTWQRIDHGVKAESTVMSIAAHPTDPARFYSCTRSGQVIGTEDGGASWQDYRLPQGVQDVYAVACI
ncbi:MAG: hypothetical protein FJY56_20530 [Betaproteobacteria bacterium]|nr:hypothetical protein [Betaproteobacteria bacterium]